MKRTSKNVSYLHRVIVIGLTSIAITLCSFGQPNNGKNGKSDTPDPAADVYLADPDNNPPDKLVSDGGGLYIHGYLGVKASINSDNTNDFLFDPDLDAKKKDIRDGLTRTLTLKLDDPVSESQTVGSAILNEAAFLNVDHLYGDVIGTPMAVGTIRYRNAQFNTTLGFLRFNSDDYPGTGRLRIEHPDDCTWIVTSDPGDPESGGDVAVLIDWDHRQETELGRFHVPFQMEIFLQNCP